jgi:mono/diheme cytochrome c family protein
MKAVGSALVYLALAVARAHAADLLQRAPERTAKISNPLAGSDDAWRAGAKLYARECASCHGPKSDGLRKAPPLNRANVYQARPGALFWVLRNGSLRRGMPSFAHLPEPERWQIITFLTMRPKT